MSRRRTPRHAYCLVALALAAAITAGRALAEQATVLPIPQDDDVRRLQAYGAELLQEIEALRRALARSEERRQQARALLESVGKRLREQLDAEQARDTTEGHSREKDVSPTPQAFDAKAEEAPQTARAAEFEKAVADLRTAVALQDAEHTKLEGELTALERARDEAARSAAELVASRDQRVNRLGERLAKAEHERERRLGELEEQQKLLGATRQELDALRAERDRDAAEASALDREMQTLRARATGQAAANDRLGADLARLTRERDDQAKQHAAALASRDAELARLSRQLAASERAATEAATRLETQAKDLAATRSALKSLQAEQQRHSERTRSLDDEVAKLRTTAMTQAAAKQQLEDELSRLAREGKEEADQRKGTIASRDAEIERLERGLATTAKVRHERDAKLAAQEEEMVSARAALETLQAKQRDRPAGEAALGHQAEGKRVNDEASRQHDAEVTTRVEALESELREVRDREEATRAEAKDLQQALVAERQMSRSKVEALQSVLQNTRNAGAELRTALDDARRKNSELSQRVGDLKQAVLKVHALRTNYQQNELQSLEPAPAQSADRKMGSEPSQQGPIAPEPDGALSKLLTTPMKARPTTSVAPTPKPGAVETPSVADGDSTADLREQLAVERERRETLEQEIQRLTASGNTEERFVEVWKALQSARSEILVLSNQLSDERQSRENLEVALARIQQESGGEKQPTSDVAQRLVETLNQRRAEADRLGEQLKNANEIIVRLKGRLEAAGSPEAENKILSDLDKENSDLRDALKVAQEANTNLRAKAETAERLAEMVYGKAH